MNHLIMGLTACAVASTASATITAIVNPPSFYNADVSIMNANLGITSAFQVESFETGTLLPGLSILTDGLPEYTRQTGPNVADEVWSGVYALHNVSGGSDGRDVRFDLAPSTVQWGFAFSHLEQSTRVIVNDSINLGDIRNIPGFVPGGPNVRNGYLWLTADAGDLIHSVFFDGPNQSDSFFIDHVAWMIPAPSSMLGFGGLGLFAARRRR